MICFTAIVTWVVGHWTQFPIWEPKGRALSPPHHLQAGEAMWMRGNCCYFPITVLVGARSQWVIVLIIFFRLSPCFCPPRPSRCLHSKLLFVLLTISNLVWTNPAWTKHIRFLHWLYLRVLKFFHDFAHYVNVDASYIAYDMYYFRYSAFTDIRGKMLSTYHI